MNLFKILKYYGLKNGTNIDFINDVVIEDMCGEIDIKQWRCSLPQPTEEEILQLAAECDANFDKYNYAELRAAAYPSIQEQLDMQYKDLLNGTSIWKDTIEAVKAKYPKA